MWLHKMKISLLLVVSALGLGLYVALGALKPLQQWNWLDIVSEGGAALLCLCWFVLVLRGRPGGRVTNYLATGLGAIFFAWWMDTLDEFVRMPDSMLLPHLLESLPMLLGLMLLTLGIYHWHREQLALTEQLRKQEGFIREHRQLDHLTPLGGADYLRLQLDYFMRQHPRNLQLIVLDINEFSRINREFSFAEGDRLLLALTQLLLLNMRNQDILCRLSGDRFVLLVPLMSDQQALQYAQDIQQCIAAFAYRSDKGECIRLTATVQPFAVTNESVQQLLRRVNFALAEQKQGLQAGQ